MFIQPKSISYVLKMVLKARKDVLVFPYFSRMEYEAKASVSLHVVANI